jgi:hypothetical protein
MQMKTQEVQNFRQDVKGSPARVAVAEKNDLVENSGKVEATRQDLFDADSVEKLMNEVPGNINSLLFSVEGIRKSRYDFKLKGHVQAPDGTLYTAYSDSNKDKGNYISASSPDGNIKWEVHVGEDGLMDIATDQNGTIYARTKNHLVALEPDGSKKFEHEFQAKVKDQVVDSRGNNYFRESTGNNIYIVDNTGKRVDTPEEMKNLKPVDMKISSDGSLWTREHGVVKKFDIEDKESRKISEYFFNDPIRKGNSLVRDFYSTRDGGILINSRKEEITTDFPHMFDAGFNSPHLPMDYFSSISKNESQFITKIDNDGNEQWTTVCPGSKPEIAVNEDGVILLSSNEKSKEDKKFHIFKIDENGKTSPFASVDYKITDFMLRPDDCHLFVRVETGSVYEFDGNGEEVNKSRPEDDKKLKFIDFSTDGRILMSDKENSEVHIWNPEDNSLQQITDHKKDHSLKTVLHEKLKEQGDKDEENKSVVLVQDDHVTINGVRIDKWKSGNKFRETFSKVMEDNPAEDAEIKALNLEDAVIVFDGVGNCEY